MLNCLNYYFFTIIYWKGGTMTELEKLEDLLEAVKYKIEILNAIEARLIIMKSLANKSSKSEVLKKERDEMQLQVDNLIREIELLDMEDTIKQ